MESMPSVTAKLPSFRFGMLPQTIVRKEILPMKVKSCLTKELIKRQNNCYYNHLYRQVLFEVPGVAAKEEWETGNAASFCCHHEPLILHFSLDNKLALPVKVPENIA